MSLKETRIGVAFNDEAYEKLQALTQALEVSQSSLMAAAILYVPEKMLASAVEVYKQETKKAKEVEKKLRKEVGSLTPEEVAMILKARQSA